MTDSHPTPCTRSLLQCDEAAATFLDGRAKNLLLEEQLDSTSRPSGNPKVIAKRNPELSKAAKSNPTSHQVEDPTRRPQHPKDIDVKRKPRGFLQRDLPRRVSRRTLSLRHLPFEGLTSSRPSRKDLPREESPEGHSPPLDIFPKGPRPPTMRPLPATRWLGSPQERVSLRTLSPLDILTTAR